MKNRYLIKSGLIAVFISVLFSCTKDDKPSYSYYVSKEPKLTLTQTYINGFIDQAAGLYPEANSIRNYIENDVTIYKLVYRTKIDGQEINASGLLCVPSLPGRYPVLSFQNGTNTRNSSAPSNQPLEPQYQLVELISSMGFIVVMADYPGFGESSQIPHPYLIKEPTVQSLIDMLYAVKEIGGAELGGVIPENEYYLLGYSQGGWATLALHNAMEVEYKDDFNLIGSACGAGPYNISDIFKGMALATTYHMPVYLGYILNAFSYYNEFDNPVSDILNAPYAARLQSLYTGNLSFSDINSQLTTSIPGLVTSGFISGFQTEQKYSGIREAMNRNSISGWNTGKQLYLMHGGADTQVPAASTESMYIEMINAGTSPLICKKEIFPGLDHGQGVIPIMTRGLLFLKGLEN